MKNVGIEIFDNTQKMADRLAEFLSAASSGKLNLVLSGGNTPRQIFDHLSEKHQNLPWHQIQYYWGDERMVPPDHPESNFLMARTHLFDKIHPDDKQIHRIHGEDDPGKAIIAYSGDIRQNIEERRGYPCFDLVMLGMGEDGHTASIFPGQPFDDTASGKTICRSAHHPDTGQERITLTMPVLNNARMVVFMVTGRNKSGIVADILNQNKSADTLPAFHIRPKYGRLFWMLDREASFYL